MYVNLVCTCEAIFEYNTEHEESALMFIHRWTNAHVQCGYMLPIENVDYVVRQELGPEDQAEQVDEPGESAGSSVL